MLSCNISPLYEFRNIFSLVKNCFVFTAPTRLSKICFAVLGVKEMFVVHDMIGKVTPIGDLKGRWRKMQLFTMVIITQHLKYSYELSKL